MRESTVIEAALVRAFGPLSQENGHPCPLTGQPRSDYLLNFTAATPAKDIARSMQSRGIASGVRRDGGRFVLRLSRDDLMQAIERDARFDWFASESQLATIPERLSA